MGMRNMYKVLIVDDEYFPREALKKTIPWEEYGCTVCGEANSGNDGIEKALKLRPDIILADINMPLMDGLDMIMNIQKQTSDILFAIVTGYSEFEYAKRGIELGVEDFILKPVDDREFLKTLKHMVETLDRKREKEQEYKSLKFWAEKNTDENRKNFLSLLLTGGADIEESQFMYECEQLGIGLTSAGYGVCCMRIDSRTYVHLSQKEWQDVIAESMGRQEDIDYTVCYLGRGNLYIIFAGLRETDWGTASVSPLMQKIQIALIRKWVCTIEVGIGTYCRTWREIGASREAADKSVREIAVSKTISEMLHYIYDHYMDPDLSLKVIAEKLFVNYSYLSAQFTKEMGMSASQYITRFRLTKAADALRGGEENMVETALSAGYTDVKYFYRCFKKEFGMTPYQYIDMLRTTREQDEEL